MPPMVPMLSPPWREPRNRCGGQLTWPGTAPVLLQLDSGARMPRGLVLPRPGSSREMGCRDVFLGLVSCQGIGGSTSARAFRWCDMLESGEYATIREIAAAETINETYVGRVLRLTLLAPEIVEAILNGKQLPYVRLPALMRPFPAGLVQPVERNRCTSKL
jgi:hypothetical protein